MLLFGESLFKAPSKKAKSALIGSPDNWVKGTVSENRLLVFLCEGFDAFTVSI